MSTTTNCVFYYSPGSRYSYLALSQVPDLEATLGVMFDWIPVVGARIRAIRGVDPFAGPPQSGQYDWDYRRHDPAVGIWYHRFQRFTITPLT